jgi:hypothetical protein
MDRSNTGVGRPPRRRTLACVAVTAALLVAACSSEDSGVDARDDATSTTTATDIDSETTAITGDTGGADDSWLRNAVEYRGRDGERVKVECAPNRMPLSLWGTGPYTDDSSICTAGVHAGVITLEDGGEVEIEIAPGQDSYEGGESNGVESRPYGEWAGSFVVLIDS